MLPLKERVFRHIRDQMLTGVIQPGQKVSEAGFAKGIGVSRTPVREALVRLETMGLIEQQPGIGTRVREPDRRDMEECFELREVLECGAARLAAQWITSEELAELDALTGQYRDIARRLQQPFTSKELDELSSRANILDLSFHLKIMAATKNRRIVQVVADVNLLTRILRRNANLPSESPLRRVSRVLLHHHRILEALRRAMPTGRLKQPGRTFAGRCRDTWLHWIGIFATPPQARRKVACSIRRVWSMCSARLKAGRAARTR